VELLENPSEFDSSGLVVTPSSKNSWRGKVSAILHLPFKTRLRRTIFGVFVVLALVLFLLVGAAVYLFLQVRGISVLGNSLKTAVEARDLDRTGEVLDQIDSKLSLVRAVFKGMFFLGAVPRLGDYYRDGNNVLEASQLTVESGKVVVKALGPYRDVLGLGSGSNIQTTLEQRLQSLLKNLPALAGSLDLVWVNTGLIREDLGKIDPSRYPEDFYGVKMRFWIGEIQGILTETEPLVSRGREILAVAPALLGSPRRTYLVLFQNDSELRATGGFITGFSLVTVRGGKVLSNNFHSGAYFASRYPAELGVPPRPLGKYLSVRKWFFQDSNYYPDFPTTAKKILGMWHKAGLTPVSGVIAVNTRIAADILKLTGPVRISGYDLDLAKKNLPESCRSGGSDFTSENLVCRLEYYVERGPHKKDGKKPNTEDRKLILDLLSDAVIKKVSSSSAEIWPRLVDFIFEHLKERDLFFFSPNLDEQSLFDGLGYSGRILSYNGDYLYVNDSNFGGKKTNMFLEESVDQTLTKTESGIWRKTVTVTYYNPEPRDKWLSDDYKDFVRIYVPKGSSLVGVAGAFQIWTNPDIWSYSVVNPSGWTESGKTVFGAYFTAWPQQKHTLTFVYDLPKDVVGGDNYNLLVQKQPGTNIGLVTVKIGATMKSVNLSQDREITVPLGK